MEEVILEKNQGQYTEYRFQVEFYVFQEKDVYISFCPSLDISASGKDFNEAIANFYESFQIHVDWCVENNTLVEDLLKHGWKVNKVTITPPSFSTLFKNKEVKSLLTGRTSSEISRRQERISLKF